MDEDRIGVALGDALIVDLHEAATGLKLPFSFPFTMRELIDFESVAQETVRFLVYQCQRYPHKVKPIPLSEIDWLPPLRRPGKIICLGTNDEGANGVSFWLKPSSSLIGHQETIQIDPAYGPIVPEPRLAIVIGKEARNVAAENALDFVYGYTIFNDVAGQLNPNPLLRGADTFGPMGPWLVTKNEIPEPNSLDITFKVDEKTALTNTTRPLNHTIEKAIETISRFQTLEPGDIIALGGIQKKPRLVDLQHCDQPCEVFISGIGRLMNPIVNG